MKKSTKIIIIIAVVVAIAAVSYWMYTKKKGPFAVSKTDTKTPLAVTAPAATA